MGRGAVEGEMGAEGTGWGQGAQKRREAWEGHSWLAEAEVPSLLAFYPISDKPLHLAAWSTTASAQRWCLRLPSQQRWKGE